MNPRLNGRNLMTIEFSASRRRIYRNSASDQETRLLSIPHGAKICKLPQTLTVSSMNKKLKTPFNIRWVQLNHLRLQKKVRKVGKPPMRNMMKLKFKKFAISLMRTKIQLRFRKNRYRAMMEKRKNVQS